MLRNYLVTALRNLARNRLYAAISIGGLALGLAAALLTAAFIRDELSFDGFLPGRESVLVAYWKWSVPGNVDQQNSWSIPQLAAWMKLDFPEVVDVERLSPQTMAVKRGDLEASEKIAWVDPGFFGLLPYPAIAGDPNAALAAPGQAVITRALARKYFGQDRPIGQTLTLRRRLPLRIAAVLEDFPGSSNLDQQIFVSSRSALSPLADEDSHPWQVGEFHGITRTFVRLRGSREAVNAAMPAFVERRMLPPPVKAILPPGGSLRITLIPLSQMHLVRDTGAPQPPTSPTILLGIATVGALVLLVACANFVNLMTARAARRAVEVGVRKASGAEPRQLIVQFLGEAMVYAVFGMICALALAELALPALEGLMLRRIPFRYWSDPQLLALVVGLTLAVGSAAGAYPAFILSSFRPSVVLKGGPAPTAGSGLIRQGLVASQFAILILLLLGVLVIERQTRFAMTQATGADIERLYRVNVDPPCRGGFKDAVAKLPGVAGVACSSGQVFWLGEDSRSIGFADGRSGIADMEAVDFGFLEQLGVRPLAGRLLSADHPRDELPYPPPPTSCLPFGSGPASGLTAPVLVDQAMARALGAAKAERALGQTFRIRMNPQSSSPVQVVGVVPSLHFDLDPRASKPMVFFVDAGCNTGLTVKVSPGREAAVVSGVARLWTALGPPRPIRARFIDEYLRSEVYAGALRQGAALTALAVIALLLGGLGMFALAAFTTERRVKEIGVRKAMGASAPDIVRLLLWSFTRPVLLANLLAWPLGWWALDAWLRGFSLRIALEPWMFLTAGGAALLIAVGTVLAHALRVARAKPVSALRYE